MNDKLKTSLEAIREMRLATLAILLCFSLLGVVLWISYDLGSEWIRQENERNAINRRFNDLEERRLGNIERLSRTIDAIDNNNQITTKQITAAVLELARAIDKLEQN